MASGRVGGTRSKISGTVGDVVYQIKRNPDGSYTQIVYGKPEDVTQTITPRGQAQKMCTSMVEALMRDLKEVGRVCMQSAANKSKSLNAFSSFNLQLVAQDCKANWYGNNQFLYPPTTWKGATYECLGGRYMISSGTGQFDLFDECLFTDQPYKIWQTGAMTSKHFSGIRFDVKLGQETFDQFMQRHRMTSLDSMFFVYFHEWGVWDPDEEADIPYTGYDFIKVSVNPSVRFSDTITRENVADFFLCESKRDIWKAISDDGSNFYVGALFEQVSSSETCPFFGAFSIYYCEGKKRITSRYLHAEGDSAENYLINNNPAEVFGSWMGDYWLKPYPSPFV